MLALTPQIIDTFNATHAAARSAYIFNFSVIAACIILTPVLTVILLAGAGRRYKTTGDESSPANNVHFNIVDKPYLDISLTLLICLVTFTMYIAFQVIEVIWNHKNITATNILVAAVVLLVVSPSLLWFMSLAKRMKAGQFWKYTLIYAVLHGIFYRFLHFCVRTVKSLWAGTRLSAKITVIMFASFLALLLIGILGAETRNFAAIFFLSFVFAFPAAFLLSRYANRIRKLEQGANDASKGNYDAPINAGGGELGRIADSINNISAGINTAVEQRMKSERLKTELITNVSHDIRTPLTSIITYTDLLRHEGLDCEKAPEYLDVLTQKSLRLKTLTEELFEAAKAATGNIEVNLTELDVTSLINQVLGELDTAIKDSGLDLRVSLPEKLIARADGRLMQRVMENLLSNVFKYSMPGSRVYLDALPVDVTSIRIDVKNISHEELNFDPAELTERFKRGDDSRADGSSGLGLSIVQSFVGAQGGRFAISIDGDLFKATVTLPTPAPPTYAY